MLAMRWQRRIDQSHNKRMLQISTEGDMKFKFDHTNKWYIHNPTPVLEKKHA